MGRPRVRSLFTRKSDPTAQQDSSAPATTADAPRAQVPTSSAPDSPGDSGHGGGVLRKLRRASLRLPLGSAASSSSSPADRLPAGSRLSAVSLSDQRLPENDSSSLSTAPTVGITGLPELDPVLRFLQNQSSRLYQEGYLLKLDDLDIHGRPCVKRDWVEYFVQLTGTVLSFWSTKRDDDAINPVTEAPALYMNLADASTRIIDSLPTNSSDVPLRNVLSISTAGRNRSLLHFTSANALTQWTSAIKLSIYEYTLLQESYTGALVAGKGKTINGIRQILSAPTNWIHGEWVRIRFRPGTPWIRCWCIIEPPSEKEIAKAQKASKRQSKSRSIYDRSPDSEQIKAKGCVLFYENKKAMKKPPFARISDAWMAYAVYPRALELIDHSTLVKVHGTIETPAEIKDHNSKDKKGHPQIATEGCVFILPETRPAVPGYEILLRFLIPLYDTFSLYGRPTRLIADTNNTRSLMFALGRNCVTPDGSASVSSHGSGLSRGYLDLLDVSSLIHADGSQLWSEQEWMRNLKNITSKKMCLQRSSVANAEPTLPDVASIGRGGFSRSPSVQPRSPTRRVSVQDHPGAIPELLTPGGSVNKGAQYAQVRNRTVTAGHVPADYVNNTNAQPEYQVGSASYQDANNGADVLGSGPVNDVLINDGNSHHSSGSFATMNRRKPAAPSLQSAEGQFVNSNHESEYRQQPMEFQPPVYPHSTSASMTQPRSSRTSIYSREDSSGAHSSIHNNNVNNAHNSVDSFAQQKDSEATLANEADTRANVPPNGVYQNPTSKRSKGDMRGDISGDDTTKLQCGEASDTYQCEPPIQGHDDTIHRKCTSAPGFHEMPIVTAASADPRHSISEFGKKDCRLEDNVPLSERETSAQISHFSGCSNFVLAPDADPGLIEKLPVAYEIGGQMLPVDRTTSSTEIPASAKLESNNDSETITKPLEEKLVVSHSPLQNAADHDCCNVSASVIPQRSYQQGMNNKVSPGSADDKNQSNSSSAAISTDDKSKSELEPASSANDAIDTQNLDNKTMSLQYQHSSESLRDLLNVVHVYNDVAAEEEQRRQEQLRIEEEERRIEQQRQLDKAAAKLERLKLNEDGSDGKQNGQAESVDDDSDLLSGHDSSFFTDSSDTERNKRHYRLKRNPTQRMGVKKVVGGDSVWGNDVIVGDVHYQSPDAELVLSAKGAPSFEKRTVVTTRTGSKRIVQVEIPRVDFGPTIAHDPSTTRGPLTADALTSTKEKGKPEGQKKAPRRDLKDERPYHHHRHRNTMLWAPGLGAAPGVTRSRNSDEQPVAMDPAQWVKQRHMQRASVSLGRGLLPQQDNASHRRASSCQVPASTPGSDISMPHVRQLLDQSQSSRRSSSQEQYRPSFSQPHSRQPSIATSDDTRGDTSASFHQSNSSASDIAESPKRLSRGKLLGVAIHGNETPVVRPTVHSRSMTAPTIDPVHKPANASPQGASLYQQRGYSTTNVRATDAVNTRELRQQILPPPNRYNYAEEMPPVLSHSRPISQTGYHGRSRGASVTQENLLPMPRENARTLAATRRPVTSYGHLTASEQEYVARKTGSSFFNLSKENAKRNLRDWGGVDLDSQNYVSAIEAREKEKELFKKSHGMIHAPNVASAIAERQARLNTQRPQTSMGYMQNTAQSIHPAAGYHYQEQRPSSFIDNGPQWMPYGHPAQSVYGVGQEFAHSGFFSQQPQQRYPNADPAAVYGIQHPYAESVASLPSVYSGTMNNPATRSQPILSNVQKQQRPQTQPQQPPQPRPNPYYHPRA